MLQLVPMTRLLTPTKALLLADGDRFRALQMRTDALDAEMTAYAARKKISKAAVVAAVCGPKKDMRPLDSQR